MPAGLYDALHAFLIVRLISFLECDELGIMKSSANRQCHIQNCSLGCCSACQLTSVCVHTALSTAESTGRCVEYILRGIHISLALLAPGLFGCSIFGNWHSIFYWHSQVCSSYELIICSLFRLSFSYPSRSFKHCRPHLITIIPTSSGRLRHLATF
jgi:hypothetical protein